MKPAQLSLARYPGAPTVHPDGSTAVVAIRRIDLEADEYTSQLWLVPTDGSPSRQLTHAWNDSSPVYSPDGRWIAFVRSTKDDAGKPSKSQVYVMPSDGGEPRKITDAKLGAEAPTWANDSRRIAFLAREAEEGRYGTDEKITPDKERPRRITRMFYRVDGVGFLNDRPHQIWVTDLDGSPEQVTKGEIDHGEIAWSPVEDLIAFVASGHEDWGNDLRSDIWLCKPDGTDRRALTEGGLSVGQPRFSPDGSTVVFIGNEVGEDGRHAVGLNTLVWSVPVTGGAVTPLMDKERFTLSGLAGGEIIAGRDGVLFPNEHRGSVQLLLVSYDGGEPRVLLDGDRELQGIAATSAGTIVATFADTQTWGDVLVRGPGGTVRTLTDFNAGYRAEAKIFGQEEITVPAPDGYPVHGWLVKPEGEGPHPVLLMIHGGPFAQYGWHLFDEAQVYAGAGYAVLYTNPRGSSGYGQAHGRHIFGNVGEASSIDLMAILDGTLASHPELDGSRMGVLGGSHGGFMTTWIAGHEGHRFKAAISERAVNAIDSFTGSSDIGWFFGADLYGGTPEDWHRQSPLTYVDNIDIPLLIIHSEQDWRCPIEQAQRLYVALRNGGKTAEMLVFPGEGHELSRGGLPSHRLARFEAILDWFGRYVK